MNIATLVLVALLVGSPCYSDKPEGCPDEPQQAPRIILGPTVIVPSDEDKLHPYIYVPVGGSCQSVNAICQKTA
jgi:hypothetical protein